MVRASRNIHRTRLIYSEPLQPSKTKLAPTPLLPIFLPSCRRCFAAIVKPSPRRLPLLLTLPFSPISVCTSSVTAIAAVSSLDLLLSSSLAASTKPRQARASSVAATVVVVSLRPPSYHKPSLRRRRCCHLVATVTTESSSHRRYRCHLVADIDAV